MSFSPKTPSHPWDLQPGIIVGMRYEIVELLGVGGMARVYRARHRSLNCDVALKILAPQQDGWNGQHENARRFEREARNAARLNHPNCVRVLDYGCCGDGSRFLAMDLVSGPTLRDELADTPRFEPSRALAVTVELLRALGHAHRHGILHRDVKPENIMFTSAETDRRLILIDFGLSQLRDDAPLTATGSCVGSPSYLAPERLLKDDYDGRADLYSVGVLLYEMLAGIRPFVSGSVIDIAKMHITRQPAPVSRYRPDLPHALVAVIDRALAKPPEHRFTSAEQMLAAVERASAVVAARSTTTAPFGLVRRLPTPAHPKPPPAEPAQDTVETTDQHLLLA